MIILEIEIETDPALVQTACLRIRVGTHELFVWLDGRRPRAAHQRVEP